MRKIFVVFLILLVQKVESDYNQRNLYNTCTAGSDCFDALRRVLPTEEVLAYAGENYINLHGSQYYCKSKSEYIAEAIATDGYFFCQDYVDYAAACDAQKESSCNNTWTIQMHQKFKNALGVYRCGAYSPIWTCQNCSDAYKRWLCSQSFQKHVIPATEQVEEGTVNGGLSPGSFQVKCPWPPVTITDPDLRLGEALKAPLSVKICNGLPTYTEYDINASVTSLANFPIPACGDALGGCQGNLILDNETASSADGFYVNSTIEITTPGSSIQGQWAVIEAYDGLNRLAMFRSWNPKTGSDNPFTDNPTASDTYRIYLAPHVVGRCRDFSKPSRRQGKSCTFPNASFLPHLLAGDVKCGEEEDCFPVPKKQTTGQDAAGRSVFPDTGFVCCPRSGYLLARVGLGEDWSVYDLAESNGNYSCTRKLGDSPYSLGAPQVFSKATPARNAGEVSGCTWNFSASSDVALDFCVLRTCFPVCEDVMRKCPNTLQFRCPKESDRREYDMTGCNIMLKQGCSIYFTPTSGTGLTTCYSLNPFGYGPEPGSTASTLFGLPPGGTCQNVGPNVGVVGIEPPRGEQPDGEPPISNVYWNIGKGAILYDRFGAIKTKVCTFAESACPLFQTTPGQCQRAT